MAKITHIPEKVETRKVVVQQEEYQLTLNKEEITLIRTLLGHILGHGPFRIACDKLHEELGRVGVPIFRINNLKPLNDLGKHNDKLEYCEHII